MGYERNNAIIVTTHDTDIEEIRAKAVEIFGEEIVSPCLKGKVNSFQTFLVGPDGSKEGWPESDLGDKDRDTFIAWLETKRFSDGSSPIDWVEVQYGDERRVTKICRHSDDKKVEET